MDLINQPAFAIAIIGITLFEFIYSRKMNLKNYSRYEVFSNLTVTGIDKILMAFAGSDGKGVVRWLESMQLYRFELPSAVEWIFIFIFSEFFYYCNHWYHHHINVGWATHIMHHSPTKFNFTLSYRLGLTRLFSLGWIVFLPVIFLGLDLNKMASMLGITFALQFFIHTELWPPIKYLDFIFNTPANHRVHHSRNPEDFNKNLGGLTVLFDHLFGTYKALDQCRNIEYGLPEIMEKKSVWYEISYQWKIVIKNFFQSRGPALKIKSLFGWS